MLLYSGGWWDSAGYAVGYDTCDTPLGPCTKTTEEAPLLASAGVQAGPGGACVVTGPTGDQWLAYHAWTPDAIGYDSGGTRSLPFGRRRGCECWARPVEQERPNDSRSVAVAALRAPDLAAVQPADHVAVLRLLAKRNVDLGRERNQIACLLHAMICELVTPRLPGAAPRPRRNDGYALAARTVRRAITTSAGLPWPRPEPAIWRSSSTGLGAPDSVFGTG